MYLDFDFEDQLHIEFEKKLIANALPKRFKDQLDQYDSAQVVDVSRSLYDVSPLEHLTTNVELEHVILAYRRPSLLVRNGAIETAASDQWQETLDAHATQLNDALNGVGRIELKDHGSLDWAGTGFLVAPNIVVTNRHVADHFVEKDGATFQWRTNPHSRKLITGRIDFLEEHHLPGQDEFEFEKVAYLADERDPDVALLQLKATPDMEPLKLAPLVEDETLIVAVGYPWKDSRVSGALEEIHLRIFNNIYDVKRAAPGKIMDASGTTVKHDCSTLGGNSGSACVNIESGQVVALHYGGEYVHNLAVSATHLRKVLG